MKIRLAMSVVTILTTSGIQLSANETTKLDTVSIVEKSETNFDFKESMKTQPKNISELLKQDASIDIAGGSPNAKRLYIRGISEALTNITIDGAKQSKDLHQHRGGLSSIDTDILKSVSVNAGVSFADQGSGNLGGSIRFETVDAQDLLEDGKNYGAFIKTTLGSIDDSYKNSLALYGKLDNNIGLLIYGNKSDSENFKTGSGKEVLGSAEEVKNYLVKLSMIDLANHSLRVSHEQNTQEGLYKFGSTGSDMGYLIDENEAVPQKVKRKTSVLNYGFNPNDLVDLGLKLYKNDQDLQRLDTSTKYSNETKGADLRNTFSFGNDTLKNELTVGVDYEENKGESQGFNRKVKDENRGLFVQNRMIFNSFNLSFGARYDDYEQTIANKKFSGDKVSPNINAEYFITDNISVFAGWGETVSSSNTVPIGWLTDNKVPTFNGSVNGDLKAQESEKYEVGTKLDFNDILANEDNLHFKLSFFETNIKNPISRVGGGMSPLVINNFPDIESKGIEAKVGYQINNFNSSISYAHAKVKQDGTEIDGAVRRTAGSYGDRIIANFDYDVSKNLGFGYQILGQLKNDNPSNDNVNNKAGYVIHNLNASFTPQEFKNLTFSLAVNNLFDKDYASHTSMVANGEAVGEAGRDVRVSLKYKF
ncbi:TonB-dependent receptor domain-containing protein [Aliarcobacter vitoriensis]|uniref:TonB-dependent receptor domain-containing protein n=1 Tax=Aliarcobacter vitoriensis TaxID=2011099 RepID=UPI003AAFDB18